MFVNTSKEKCIIDWTHLLILFFCIRPDSAYGFRRLKRTFQPKSVNDKSKDFMTDLIYCYGSECQSLKVKISLFICICILMLNEKKWNLEE